MKEKTPRRNSKAAREAAAKELSELLPGLESAASEPEDKEKAVKSAADRARVQRALTYSVERVNKEIADLQLSIGRMLSDLSQQLAQESSKLSEIQLAIETESARLRELHDLDVSMLSLKAILEVAAEKRAALDAELQQRESEFQAAVDQKNKQWTQEQADYESKTKRAREREEEDYAYKISLKRRKDADDYAARQTALENALDVRERAMDARQAEIKELQAKVEHFPQELASAVKQAEQNARSEAQKQSALDAKLVKLEFEAEKNITALKIAGLEESLKRQSAQLDASTKQLAAAQGQVQAMALKAIEGSAVMKSAPGS